MIVYYVCPVCHEDWDEEYECACDSECPNCGESDIEACDWEEDEDPTPGAYLGYDENPPRLVEIFDQHDFDEDGFCSYCNEESRPSLGVECRGRHGAGPKPGATPPEEKQMYGDETQDKSTGFYEVAAILRPTVLAAQGGAVAKAILEPTTVVASSRSGAIAVATRKIEGTVTDADLQRVDWMVRRFKGDNA